MMLLKREISGLKLLRFYLVRVLKEANKEADSVKGVVFGVGWVGLESRRRRDDVATNGSDLNRIVGVVLYVSLDT